MTDLFSLPKIDHEAVDRQRRDELSPAEDEAMANDREFYLECMHGQTLRERSTYQEIRDGLILYGMIYCRLKEYRAKYGD